MGLFRFFLGIWFIRLIGNMFQNMGMGINAAKALDKEYEGNESWSKGKKEAIQYLVICVILLIVLSCLTH